MIKRPNKAIEKLVKALGRDKKTKIETIDLLYFKNDLKSKHFPPKSCRELFVRQTEVYAKWVDEKSGKI